MKIAYVRKLYLMEGLVFPRSNNTYYLGLDIDIGLNDVPGRLGSSHGGLLRMINHIAGLRTMRYRYV
jgi:hypothetical protein